MTQEIQVTLTLEVDVEQSKLQIKKYISTLINFATLKDLTYNRMLYKSIKVTDVKEESEIYETK